RRGTRHDARWTPMKARTFLFGRSMDCAGSLSRGATARWSHLLLNCGKGPGHPVPVVDRRRAVSLAKTPVPPCSTASADGGGQRSRQAGNPAPPLRRGNIFLAKGPFFSLIAVTEVT